MDSSGNMGYTKIQLYLYGSDGFFLDSNHRKKGEVMKRIFGILVVICFLFSGLAAAQPPSAEVFAVESNPLEKLQRGVLNLADAVVEVPGTMLRKSKRENPAVGFTIGAVEGVMNTVKRALAGVWEIATFPIPIPENYEPILPEPEFLNFR